jgi:CO/xanthine dehydrogenase FAD-binding subunit
MNIQYFRPTSLTEALQCLQDSAYQNRLLAGGTDLMVQLRNHPEDNSRLIDISRLEDLKKVEVGLDKVVIGAAVTFNEILLNVELQKSVPLFMLACSQIGGPQIRNRGTIGGNVVNAAVCADTLPVLVCLEAEVSLTNGISSRKLLISEFISSKNHTNIKPGEILTQFSFLKPSPQTRLAYIKLGRRNAMAISRISLSLLGSLNQDGTIQSCRMAFGAISECVSRFSEVEDALQGKKPDLKHFETCGQIATSKLIALQGRRWSTEYKEKVVTNLCKRALQKAFLQESVPIIGETC